jgi:hypothetical protein
MGNKINEQIELPEHDLMAEEIVNKHQKESLPQTIYGVRFPWESAFFVVVGALSEVVDAIFLCNTLMVLSDDMVLVQAILISAIVGAGCFFSMAFVGFQLGNKRYYTKFGERISYGFWISAGFALVAAKIIAGLTTGTTTIFDVTAGNAELFEVFQTEEFIKNAVIAIVQFILYVGTGFITRDSVKIITDNDMREYFLARRKYKKLLKQLSNMRGDIIEDVSVAKTYPIYAKRLVESKEAAKDNVKQYNAATRALIEAKMSIAVEPDLMEEMYDNAMKKEKDEEQL